MRIHRHIAVAVLVAQACKRMSEFVNHNWFESWVTHHREVVRVQYAASTIVFGVHQHDDVLVRRACQPVVQSLQMQRCKVSVAVKGVEVGVQGGVLPYSFARD